MPQAPLLGPSPENTHSDDLKAPSSSESATVLPGERLSEDAEDTRVGDEKKGKVVAQLSKELPTGSQDEDNDDVIWIDWEGPDDPENPKKYVLNLFVFY